jgi:hypothetical protein
MNSYILLRNNKESGSLTFADLQKIGLRSTDLIWVECQSVSWRGAGEITELKALVGAEPVQENLPATVVDSPETVLPIKKVTEKKSVFVELPTNKPAFEKQAQKLSSVDPESEINRNYSGIGGFEKSKKLEESAELETKYCGSLDDLKVMYRKNLEQKRGKKFNPIQLPKGVKKAALYAGLILVGALSTLLITKTGSNKNETGAIQDKVKPAEVKPITKPVNTDPSINPATTLQNDQANIPIEESASRDQNSAISNLRTKEELSGTDKIITGNSKPQDEEGGDDITMIANENNEKPANEKPTSRIISPEVVSSDVTIKPNKYVVGDFGGIRNLELTLQNDSKYLLDEVTVELEYLNYNGNTVKKENIHFQSIQPGSAQTIAVPKSKRGVKISHKVKKIEAKETGLSSVGSH